MVGLSTILLARKKDLQVQIELIGPHFLVIRYFI